MHKFLKDTTMLIKFAVTNYRGFADRIELDLSHPNNYTFNTFAIKDGVVKNGIIYGSNGCGKTNFSLAIFDIVNHLSQKWKKLNYYTNFKNAGSKDDAVRFEYTFNLGGTTLYYNYAKDKNGGLLTEKLSVGKDVVFDKTRDGLEIDGTQFPIDAKVKDSLAANANQVSIVNYLLTSFPLAHDHYLIKLKDFVNSMLWFRCLDTREFIGLDTSVTNIEEYIINNGLLEDFHDFLSKVSSQEFEFAEPSKGDKQILCKYGDGTIPFLQIASTGTQSLQLLFYWIKQMGKASFVFIDEFDAFYHFRLSYEVCKLLFNLDCQVFTSSHNTYLMTNDLLRPDCNFIIGGNKIKPLNECTDKELRFGHNIEKMFRGNAFSL